MALALTGQIDPNALNPGYNPSAPPGGPLAPPPVNQSVPVKLPNGTIINVASMAEAQLLDAQYKQLVMMQQQQRTYNIGGGGGGGGGGWSTNQVVEGGVAAAELVSGLGNSRLIKKAKSARKRYKTAKTNLLLWLTNPPKDAAGNVEYFKFITAIAEMFQAAEDAERCQDDLIGNIAWMAYIRAGGGAIKLFAGEGGGFLDGMGTAGGIALGAGGALVLSKLLEDDDEDE